MPRLVREHGDRAAGPREGLHAVLELQLVETVAEVRNEERDVPADRCDPVSVLDDADVTAARVTDDARRVPRDERRLAREGGLGAGAVGLPDSRPAVRVDGEEEDARDKCDRGER